ncbi:MAG: flagellar filament capping protein FliD [Actinobacteria bacterium]|nr:flagellar filament capping protein FliD [Actinomycetota bacterium]
MTYYMSSIGGVSGLFSGVNWREVIDSLLALERKPVTLLQQKQQRLGVQITALNEINARLLELKTRAFNLSLASTINARKVEVSGSALSATATAEAQPGTYRVTVLSLATPTVAASSLPLGEAVDTTLPLSQVLPSAPRAGYFTVNGTRVYLDADTTLAWGENSVVERVNASGAGARAVLLQDAAGRLNHLALYAAGQELVAGSASDTSDFLSLAGFFGAGSAWVGGVAEGSVENTVAGGLSSDAVVTFTYGGISYQTGAGEVGPVEEGVTTLAELASRLEAAMNRALDGAGRVSVAVDDPSGSGNGRLVVMDRSGGGEVAVTGLSGTETSGLQSLLSSGGAQTGRAAVGQLPLGRLSTSKFLYQAGFDVHLRDGWLSGFLSARDDKAGFDLEGTETVTFTYRGASYQTAALEAVQAGVTDLSAVAADLEAKMNAALGENGSVSVSLLRDEEGRVRLSVTDLVEEASDSRTLEFTSGPDALGLVESLGGRAGGAVSLNGKVVYYDKYADTLSGLISRINSAGAGVRAAYDPLTDRVTFTSTSTGPLALDLADAGGNLLGALGVEDAGSQVLGESASFIVEGYNGDQPIYSLSNTVSGMIPGLTLQLKEVSGKDSGGRYLPTVITVDTDVDAAVKNVKDFVESYNQALDKIYGYLRYDAETEQAGLLAGISQAREILDRLRSLPSFLPEGLEGSPRTLMDIGISLGGLGASLKEVKSGRLQVDEAKLSTALRENPEGVLRLLGAYTGQVSLRSGGTGSITSASGRPTGETRAGTYRIVSDAQGNLTAYFAPAGGTEELVGTGTISAYGTNDTLIPGVTLRAGALREGEDRLDKEENATGILKRLEDYLAQVTSSGGVLFGLTESLQKTTQDLASQVERMEERIKAREVRLIAQFTTMETLLARMQTQSQWLTNQIQTLNNSWMRSGGS